MLTSPSNGKDVVFSITYKKTQKRHHQKRISCYDDNTVRLYKTMNKIQKIKIIIKEAYG